jgi:hypothetical protein
MSEWTDQAEKVAAAKGLIVIVPKEDELFIDIDDKPSLAAFHVGLGVLGDLIVGFTRGPSPSGKNDRFHIIVKLARKVKDDFERGALQALLGSDRLHEALSWRAASRGITGVSVFFEKRTDIP